jgi:hypothetical protein
VQQAPQFLHEFAIPHKLPAERRLSSPAMPGRMTVLSDDVGNRISLKGGS